MSHSDSSSPCRHTLSAESHINNCYTFMFILPALKKQITLIFFYCFQGEAQGRYILPDPLVPLAPTLTFVLKTSRRPLGGKISMPSLALADFPLFPFPIGIFRCPLRWKSARPPWFVALLREKITPARCAHAWITDAFGVLFALGPAFQPKLVFKNVFVRKTILNRKEN